MPRFEIGWYNGWSPDERRAVSPVQSEAIRSGAMPRPVTCSICGHTAQAGSSNYVWLHSENYADPLAVHHICRNCHWILHERFDKPRPWLELVAQHATGDGWFEPLTMDPASLRQPFDATYPAGLPLR